MKKVLFAATLSLLSLVVFGQTKVDAVVKMNTEKYDFGKIKQGEPVNYSFEIKNISIAVSKESLYTSKSLTLSIFLLF